MKIKITIILTFLLAFFSSTTFSQEKYDYVQDPDTLVQKKLGTMAGFKIWIIDALGHLFSVGNN